MSNLILFATFAFCRIVTPTTITYAPNWLPIPYEVTNIIQHTEWVETNIVINYKSEHHPNTSQYISQGWFINSISQPEYHDGYVAILNKYDIQNNSVIALYDYEPVQKQPIKYSKLKIYGTITQLGKWNEIENWLKTKTINGLNGWTAFSLAQEISDDHPMFEPLATEAQQILGLTNEQFQELLSQCILNE